MTKTNPVEGGKGDNKSLSDFDSSEVEMGIRVEMEHTDDRNVAEDIVKDHLTEDPHYYSKLKNAGLADELKEAVLKDLALVEAKKKEQLLDTYKISPEQLKRTQDPTLTPDDIKHIAVQDIMSKEFIHDKQPHILDINQIRASNNALHDTRHHAAKAHRDIHGSGDKIKTVQSMILKISSNS